MKDENTGKRSKEDTNLDIKDNKDNTDSTDNKDNKDNKDTKDTADTKDNKDTKNIRISRPVWTEKICWTPQTMMIPWIVPKVRNRTKMKHSI